MMETIWTSKFHHLYNMALVSLGKFFPAMIFFLNYAFHLACSEVCILNCAYVGMYPPPYELLTLPVMEESTASLEALLSYQQ